MGERCKKKKLQANYRQMKKWELKTTTLKAWQSMTKEETWHLVMSVGSRLQAGTDCKGFATRYNKDNVIYDQVRRPVTFASLNRAGPKEL